MDNVIITAGHLLGTSGILVIVGSAWVVAAVRTIVWCQ